MLATIAAIISIILTVIMNDSLKVITVMNINYYNSVSLKIEIKFTGIDYFNFYS